MHREKLRVDLPVRWKRPTAQCLPRRRPDYDLRVGFARSRRLARLLPRRQPAPDRMLFRSSSPTALSPIPRQTAATTRRLPLPETADAPPAPIPRREGSSVQSAAGQDSCSGNAHGLMYLLRCVDCATRTKAHGCDGVCDWVCGGAETPAPEANDSKTERIQRAPSTRLPSSVAAVLCLLLCQMPAVAG